MKEKDKRNRDINRLFQVHLDVQAKDYKRARNRDIHSLPSSEKSFEFVNAFIHFATMEQQIAENTLISAFGKRLGMTGIQIYKLLPDALELSWANLTDDQKGYFARDTETKISEFKERLSPAQ